MAGNLAQTWRRHRKTFVFVGAAPVLSAQRPNAFFYDAVPPPTWLGFTATIFVGVGLLLTFVALVAGLTFAADGMRESDSRGMLDALRNLLAAASSKCVSSIA